MVTPLSQTIGLNPIQWRHRESLNFFAGTLFSKISASLYRKSTEQWNFAKESREQTPLWDPFKSRAPPPSLYEKNTPCFGHLLRARAPSRGYTTRA